jgi:cellobiose phosphorylase
MIGRNAAAMSCDQILLPTLTLKSRGATEAGVKAGVRSNDKDVGLSTVMVTAAVVAPPAGREGSAVWEDQQGGTASKGKHSSEPVIKVRAQPIPTIKRNSSALRCKARARDGDCYSWLTHSRLDEYSPSSVYPLT